MLPDLVKVHDFGVLGTLITRMTSSESGARTYLIAVNHEFTLQNTAVLQGTRGLPWLQ
jgi:hypothetical protein